MHSGTSFQSTRVRGRGIQYTAFRTTMEDEWRFVVMRERIRDPGSMGMIWATLRVLRRGGSYLNAMIEYIHGSVLYMAGSCSHGISTRRTSRNTLSTSSDSPLLSRPVCAALLKSGGDWSHGTCWLKSLDMSKVQVPFDTSTCRSRCGTASPAWCLQLWTGGSTLFPARQCPEVVPQSTQRNA